MCFGACRGKMDVGWLKDSGFLGKFLDVLDEPE